MTQLLIKMLLMVLLLTGLALQSAPLSFASSPENDINWKNTALIIIDIQNDYFPGGNKEVFESDKAAIKARDLLTAFRKQNLNLIHIRHEATGNSTYFLPNTPGADIHWLVKPVSNETVIVKHRPSSFFETSLAEELKKRGISHLLLCGMRTNVCVQATTLEALKLGYKVTVAVDAVAALNITEHDAGLKVIAENKVPLIKTDQLVQSINQTAK
jgi:nicotinamidase-related amidase